MRESSTVGESEMDRRSRRWVAMICGGLIGILTAAAIAWAWLAS